MSGQRDGGLSTFFYDFAAFDVKITAANESLFATIRTGNIR